MFSKKEKFFCAFCKSPRKVSLKKNVTFVEFGYCGLAAVLLSLLFWQSLDARILVIFGVLLSFMEIALQLRWRLSISCPYCGFDPVLFKKNKRKTAEKIRNHLERRKNDPHALLLRNYKLEIPKPPTPPSPTAPLLSKKGKKLDVSL